MAQENMSLGVTDSQQPKRPIKLGFALLIGPACWLGPYVGVSATLLPAKIGELAPDNKVALVAIASAIAMIVATIANIIAVHYLTLLEHVTENVHHGLLSTLYYRHFA